MTPSATKKRNLALKRRRSPLARLARVVLFGFLGLVLALAGALVWLRTQSGADFVFARTKDALAKSGFQLTAGAVEGPLPNRLMIRDARLADARGPLFQAGLVEVRLAPLALLRGVAHVPLIEATDPEVIRLPASEPAPEEESGPFSLPVGVQVDRIALTGGRVQAGALAALGLDTPLLALTVEGHARLVDERPTAELTLRVWPPEAGEDADILAAALRLGADPASGRDHLDLSLKVNDGPGGFLAGLMQDPAWPGLRLELTGQGGLNDWPGRLEVVSGDARLTADLKFQGASGRLWGDLLSRPDWKAELSAALAPGPFLPPHLAPVTGPDLALNLKAGRSGQAVDADLRLTGSAEPALDLQIKAAGALTKNGGDFTLDTSLAGLLPPEAAPDGQSALTLTAEAALDQAGQTIKNLAIQGAGISLKAEARHQAADGALKADLELKTAEGSPWVAEGLRLAGLGPEDFGGDLELAGHLDWRGAAQPVNGQLRLVGRHLRWPGPELHRLLGPDLHLEADLGGGGDRPLTAHINPFRAGEVSLAGQVEYRPAENPARSTLAADLKAGLGRLEALAPDLGGALALNLEANGRLDELTARLALTSDRVTTPQGALSQPSLTLTVKGAALAGETTGAAGAGPDLSGRLDLAAADSPGGPLALGADWLFRQGGDGLSAAVSNLQGQLAGLNLAGDLALRTGPTPADANTDASQSPASSDPEAPSPAPTPAAVDMRLDGLVTADLTDWSRLAALVGQPLTGAPLTLRLNLAAPEGRQRASAELDIPQLKLGAGAETILALGQTNLNFQAEDLFGRPGLDLDLRLGAGQTGSTTWGGGQVQAKGSAGTGDFTVTVSRLKMAALGGGAKDGLNLAGQYDLTSAPVIDLARLDFLIGGSGLKLSKPLRLALGNSARIGPLTAAFLPAGTLAAEADLTPGAMKVKADLKRLPYRFFKAFAPADAALPDGEIQSLTVDLAQGPAGLAGDFALKTQASVKELKNLRPRLDLKGRLAAGPAPSLAVEGTLGGGPGWDASGKFNATIGLTPGRDGGPPALADNAPLTGQFNFTGAVAPLWRLLGQPDRSLTGVARVKLDVSGPLSKPQPLGSVYLAGGRYRDQVLGLLINDINLEAQSTPELPLRALLAAKDGQGGGLALEASVKDLANPALSAKGRVSRFNPLHRDDLSIFLSGDFGAEGPLDRLQVNSNLTVDRGEVDLSMALAGGSVSTLEISRKGDKAVAVGGGPRLNLSVTIPNQLFIRGFGLESEWKGNLKVQGSTRRPSLVGALAPVRGYFEIFSKEFQFTGGDISFNGGTNPNLNLELTNQGPNITAIIRAGGTGDKPTLKMESRPPLPQEEVLAQVLFGKDAASISRFEALQLAAAVRELTTFGSGGGGIGALGQVREGLGLDVLRLGGTESDRERRASSLAGTMGQEMAGTGQNRPTGQGDDISVEAGKYISDKVYVGVEHRATGGAAVRLEVELAPSISLEARTTPDSSQLGLGWKKDY